MKQFFEFIPLIVFFAVYKLQDIYAATLALIIATALMLGLAWLKNRKVERMHLISFVLILVFGGLTLFLRDDDFIKWKPTVINWLFGAVLIGSQLFKQPILKKMLGKELKLPEATWNQLNFAWGLFFIVCGGLNLYVAFRFSEEAWVNFKVFGLLGLTLAFTIATVAFVYKHLPQEKTDSLEKDN